MSQATNAGNTTRDITSEAVVLTHVRRLREPPAEVTLDLALSGLVAAGDQDYEVRAKRDGVTVGEPQTITVADGVTVGGIRQYVFTELPGTTTVTVKSSSNADTAVTAAASLTERSASASAPLVAAEDFHAPGYELLGNNHRLIVPHGTETNLQPQLIFPGDWPISFPAGITCLLFFTRYHADNATEGGGVYLMLCTGDPSNADDWITLAQAISAGLVDWTDDPTYSGRVFAYDDEGSHTETADFFTLVDDDGVTQVYMTFHNDDVPSEPGPAQQVTMLARMGANPTEWAAVKTNNSAIITPLTTFAGPSSWPNGHRGYGLTSRPGVTLSGRPFASYMKTLWGGGSNTGLAIWGIDDEGPATLLAIGKYGFGGAAFGLPSDYRYPPLPNCGTWDRQGNVLVDIDVIGQASPGGAAATGELYAFVRDAETFELLAQPKLVIPRGTIGDADASRIIPSKLIARDGRYLLVCRVVNAANEWGVGIYTLTATRSRYERLPSLASGPATRLDLRRLVDQNDAQLQVSNGGGLVRVSPKDGLTLDVDNATQMVGDPRTFVPARFRRVRAKFMGLRLSEINQSPPDGTEDPENTNPGMAMGFRRASLPVNHAFVWNEPTVAINFGATDGADADSNPDILMQTSPYGGDAAANAGVLTEAMETSYIRRETGAFDADLTRDVAIEIDFVTGDVLFYGDFMTPSAAGRLTQAQLDQIAPHLGEEWMPFIRLSQGQGRRATYTLREMWAEPFYDSAPPRDGSQSLLHGGLPIDQRAELATAAVASEAALRESIQANSQVEVAVELSSVTADNAEQLSATVNASRDGQPFVASSVLVRFSESLSMAAAVGVPEEPLDDPNPSPLVLSTLLGGGEAIAEDGFVEVTLTDEVGTLRRLFSWDADSQTATPYATLGGTATLVGQQAQQLEQASQGGGGAALATDVEDANVPESRTAVLVRSGSGLRSQEPLTLNAGETGNHAPLLAARFADDLAIGGRVLVVDDVSIDGTPAGLTLSQTSTFKRDKSEVRFVLNAIAAGTYVVRIRLRYADGSGGAVGLVDVVVA